MADPMTFYTRSQLRGRPGVTWLVDGWIQARGTGVIFGESESYKSFLVIDLLCSLATGTPWLNRATRAGLVVYVVGEGEEGIPARVEAWERAHGLAIADDNILFLLEPVILDDPASVELFRQRLRAQVGEREIQMIVFDTVSTCMSGEDGSENDNSKIASVVRLVGALAREFNAAALLVHHNTPNTEKARGASAFRCNTDFQYFIQRTGDHLQLKNKKMRNGRTPPTVTLQVHEVPLDDGTCCWLELVAERDEPRGPKPPPRQAVKALAALHDQWTRNPGQKVLEAAAAAGLTEEQWKHYRKILRAHSLIDRDEANSYYVTAEGLALLGPSPNA